MPTKHTHISPVDSAALGGPTGPGMLVHSPTHRPAMSELFQRGATRQYGDTALAQWLTREAPRHGGAPRDPSEVRRWFKNRVYLGEVRHGRLVNTEAHTPLTTERTWNRCQREPREQRKAASPFLLTGLIRCAACRYAMGRQANGGPDGQTPIYHCPRSTRGCPGPSVITAKRVEEYVTSLVSERQQDLLIGQAERCLTLARLAGRPVGTRDTGDAGLTGAAVVHGPVTRPQNGSVGVVALGSDAGPILFPRAKDRSQRN